GFSLVFMWFNAFSVFCASPAFRDLVKPWASWISRRKEARLSAGLSSVGELGTDFAAAALMILLLSGRNCRASMESFPAGLDIHGTLPWATCRTASRA